MNLYAESVIMDNFLEVEQWSDLLLLTDSSALLPLHQEAVLKLYFSTIWWMTKIKPIDRRHLASPDCLPKISPESLPITQADNNDGTATHLVRRV